MSLSFTCLPGSSSSIQFSPLPQPVVTHTPLNPFSNSVKQHVQQPRYQCLYRVYSLANARNQQRRDVQRSKRRCPRCRLDRILRTRVFTPHSPFDRYLKYPGFDEEVGEGKGNNRYRGGDSEGVPINNINIVASIINSTLILLTLEAGF